MHCAAWNEPAPPVMPWKTTLVSLLTNTLMVAFLNSADRGDDLLGSVGHAIGGLDGEAAVVENLSTELDVRALEAHDQRHLEPELLRRGHDAFGDEVALGDAAEDVDEDALHLG